MNPDKLRKAMRKLEKTGEVPDLDGFADAWEEGLDAKYHEGYRAAWQARQARIEELEALRNWVQFFVRAPTKFGIRHQAYMKMRKMLDALAEKD